MTVAFETLVRRGRPLGPDGDRRGSLLSDADLDTWLRRNLTSRWDLERLAREAALNLVGTLPECIASIRWMVGRTGVDEIVLADLSSDPARHLDSIDAVAAAIGAS
jgi:hypothetical protein